MSKQPFNKYPLPDNLYRADQVRAMDRVAIDEFDIPGIELMNRAGEAALAVILKKWPCAQHLGILCGAGNNGGDGYVVGRLAIKRGLAVTLYAFAAVDRLKGDALTAARAYQACGGIISADSGSDTLFQGVALLVDGLLGTGIDRNIDGRYAEVIAAVNRFAGPVIALDIPSGLSADSGCRMGCAVEADHTITFIGLKQGLFTGDAVNHCGEISFASLDVPAEVERSQTPSACFTTAQPVIFKPRRRSTHKGECGHLLVIGGEAGYSGAVRLAAEAALRVGVGLVTVATRESHANLINLGRPEIISRGVEDREMLKVLIDQASVVVIGPGLGQSPWALEFFWQVCHSERPVVVDADALNLLAKQPNCSNNWILTPHPGEAGRLLKMTAAAVNYDRYIAAKAIQQRYGGVAVLKGAGTVIDDGSSTMVNKTGNPGMASAGMGDLLSGVIGGLIAQKLSLFDAARVGVTLHGAAADRAAKAGGGERGLLASDLMDYLRIEVNQ